MFRVVLGGCQNYGPFLGVRIKGDIDKDVDVYTDSMGGCQNYGLLLGPLKIMCRIIVRSQNGS